MASEHTAAPWGSRDTRDSGTEIISDHFDGLVIATVYPRDSWHTAHSADQDTDPVQEANARVMSAAPDLLAALEGLIAEIGVDWPDSWDASAYEEAVAAIAKARGDSCD